MYYTGITLDRAVNLRDDPAWIDARLQDPDTEIIPLWRGKCLVNGDRPITVGATSASSLIEASCCLAFLGLDHKHAYFAVDLSKVDESAALDLCQAERAVDARELVPALPTTRAGILAYARGLLHWHKNQQFCGICGGVTTPAPAGQHRRCLSCDAQLFPRIEPAIIVLVELPGTPRRCLLARAAGADPDRFSTVAGFLDVGESLEDGVRREVAEETGVTVGDVRYLGSQAWPFPAGLMVGFHALATSDRISIDESEVCEARWFTAAELRSRICDPLTYPPFRIDSIGKHLIDTWLDDNDPALPLG